MKGAIIGDIVGSVYEFNNIKTKEFPLYKSGKRGCIFTDDTVLTCAVAQAVMNADKARDENGKINLEAFQKVCEVNFRLFATTYWGRGYGGRFREWVYKPSMGPYNSCGNGSAMRVSPVAWVARDEVECISLARATALPTHNHSDGIKGAVVTALCIYYALNGHTKEQIREMAEKYYPLDFTIDEIRPTYEWGSVCSNTVPQAIVAFLDSDSMEDTIRNAISIGGDSDTIAAIAGPIAQAYYGLDEKMWEGAKEFIGSEDKLMKIIEDFSKEYCEK